MGRIIHFDQQVTRLLEEAHENHPEPGWVDCQSPRCQQLFAILVFAAGNAFNAAAAS